MPRGKKVATFAEAAALQAALKAVDDVLPGEPKVSSGAPKVGVW